MPVCSFSSSVTLSRWRPWVHDLSGRESWIIDVLRASRLCTVQINKLSEGTGIGGNRHSSRYVFPHPSQGDIVVQSFSPLLTGHTPLSLEMGPPLLGSGRLYIGRNQVYLKPSIHSTVQYRYVCIYIDTTWYLSMYRAACLPNLGNLNLKRSWQETIRVDRLLFFLFDTFDPPIISSPP